MAPVRMPAKLQAINKQRKLRQLDNAAVIGKLYCEGMPQGKIAEKLGINRDTVTTSLNLIRKVWRERLGDTIELHRAEQLAKIDRVESEAWEAWWESKKAVIELKREIENSPDGVKTKKSKLKKMQTGEVRFLELVSKQVEMRSKILGLDKPESAVGGNTSLLEVVVSTRAEAARMLPYMEFKDEIIDGEVVSSTSKGGSADASGY